MPVIQTEVALTLDNIVVATDFTPESEKALSYARALAHQFATRITLAHVIDLSAATPLPDAIVGLPLDKLRHDSAENIKRTLFDLGMEGVTAQGKTLEAHNPTSAIVDLSHKLDADLIIVGTHARHGLSKLILGSCSKGIIHSARCPVLTIGPNADPDPVDLAFRSIVFATDLKHDAVEKASVALAFAKKTIANVRICHVIEDHAEFFADAFRQHARAEYALARLIPEASYTWCSPKSSALFGNVDREILRLARANQTDLIVLGAHRNSPFLSRFWDGVVEDVIRQAPCPVLTICTG
ncbi:universal stress protein [Edaphobacter aggregans]|uniref:universal stress protein n=1 Tax=Edaphobacter aggregans TaxID=570835 RepID=UPI000558253F|nr:universal stress protein [Edaphobacter aggregans]